MSSKAQLKRVLLKLLFRFNKVFEGAECLGGLPKGADELPPPIFIIGAPRSGSTLFYQYLTAALKVGYLTNAHCLFFGFPALVESVLRLSDRRSSTDFQSNHGRTRGFLAPSECGEYWYRFFRRYPQYVPLGDMEDRALYKMELAVLRLIATMRKPLIIKNLVNTLRLECLSRAFPRAVFLVTHREICSNARSLLHGRMQVRGSYGERWAVEPPSMDSVLSLHPVDQVFHQIRQIYELIRQVEDSQCELRFLHISYELFCQRPDAEINRIVAFLQRAGVDVCYRNTSLPGQFPLSSGSSLPEEYERRIAYCASINNAELPNCDV